MTRRILVDLLGFTGSRGGTETYAREICRRLPEAMPGDVFAAITGREGAEGVREFFPGEVHVIPWVGADRVTWALGEVLAADAVARRTHADLVWTPANFGPILRGVPRVSTIHDVTYHELSGNPIERLVHRTTAWLMERTARTATAVISGSAAAAHDVAARMRVPREEIQVVPHGTNAPTPVADPWSVLAPLGITAGRPIVLSTGNRLPHKNFEGLLRALAEIPRDRRPLTVITGGGAEDPLRDLVKSLGLEDDVVLPGWVSGAQLESLFAVASLYVCPSLAEGFGLPVIDAMRRGRLVLANDIPVLREVGGDSALYADATSAPAFGAAITAALAEPVERAATGQTWARQFTWERSTARTAAVFGSVLDADD